MNHNLSKIESPEATIEPTLELTMLGILLLSVIVTFMSTFPV
jgi:hypothetical protein